MIRRQFVVSEFFDQAETMREQLDVRFKNPYVHTINWEYYCDPKMYTYLRATPNMVFEQAVFDSLMKRLRAWCIENLGLVPMGEPYLHLMVNGCKLGLHSDFHNGVWGYVYSLTRWENRRFAGGETLLLRDGASSYKKHHVHGDALYELIPALFNQLFVFDDRIVHATSTIEGSMDPADGRIALVGHIRATSPITEGTITESQASKVIMQALPHLRDRIKTYTNVQGTASYRLTVAATGAVESVAILTDNVVTAVTGYGNSDAVSAVKSQINQAMSSLQFPPTGGISTVVVAVLIPIPDLRPIELVIPHQSSRSAVQQWARSFLETGQGTDLRGYWEGESFVVKEPLAGSIQFEPLWTTCRFDAPMWVPSQRERFEVTLMEWAKMGWPPDSERHVRQGSTIY